MTLACHLHDQRLAQRSGTYSPRLSGVAAASWPTSAHGPLGGVVRFARLMHRRVRDLGGPTVRAAFGGNQSLAWLPRKVVRYERRAAARRRPGRSEPVARCRSWTIVRPGLGCGPGDDRSSPHGTALGQRPVSAHAPSTSAAFIHLIRLFPLEAWSRTGWTR
jgi:hypothetical protein